MKNRNTELRKLVRALRAEFSRLYQENWYTYDEDDPQRTLRVHQNALHEIKHALQMADTGAYGTCLDCETPIPLVRLEARPTSVRCIHCQERLEVSTAA